MQSICRAGRIVGLVATGALALAACGGGGSSDEKSSAGGSSAGSASSDQAVKYAQCMRRHGVKDFPDPQNGRLVLRAGQGGVDPSSATYKSAASACQSLAPSGAQTTGGGGQAQQAGVLKFARCMRKNGVPKFPDPQISGGRVTSQLPAGVDPNSDAFKNAQAKCSSLLSGGGAQ